MLGNDVVMYRVTIITRTISKFYFEDFGELRVVMVADPVTDFFTRQISFTEQLLSQIQAVLNEVGSKGSPYFLFE